MHEHTWLHAPAVPAAAASERRACATLSACQNAARLHLHAEEAAWRCRPAGCTICVQGLGALAPMHMHARPAAGNLPSRACLPPPASYTSTPPSPAPFPTPSPAHATVPTPPPRPSLPSARAVCADAAVAAGRAPLLQDKRSGLLGSGDEARHCQASARCDAGWRVPAPHPQTRCPAHPALLRCNPCPDLLR